MGAAGVGQGGRAIALGVVLVLGALTGCASVGAGRPGASSPVGPTVGGISEQHTTTAQTVAAASPGAVGIGDTLFPGLGNGGYQVEHYGLDLRYPTTSPGDPLTGTVTVEAVTTQALSRFDLDFAGDGDGVGSVAVNGQPATYTRSGEELVITPTAALADGARFVVTVAGLRATPAVANPKTMGTTAFVRTPDGTVWTGQPAGMHKIFPCNDHPDDKATFSFRIDVPAGITAVANGDLVDRTTSGGRTVWRYEERDPMATELAQLAVGRFTVISRSTQAGVVVRDVVPTRLVAGLRAKLTIVTDQLAWMQQRVGPYPFTSYGSLYVDSDLGFALETQTLSIFDPVGLSRPGGVWKAMMLHELAHQWFGDSVAPATWRDVWQSEGHATWYELTYAAENGLLAADTGMSGANTLDAVMRWIYAFGDRVRAQYGPPGAPRSGEMRALFNPNVYYGGALVLYALRQQIGAAAFERLERTWVSTYRGRSASTANFIALASKVSGTNLGPFLRNWLYAAKTPPMPGHPTWKQST